MTPRRNLWRIVRSTAIFLLVLLVAIAGWSLMPLAAWLPHERIVLSLPFAPENDAQSMIPMGETIEHPDSPHGHPGIDFSWDHSVPIIACARGRISDISYIANHKSWDIIVRTGVYEVRYKELEDYDRELQEGMLIEQGRLLGYPCHPVNLPDGNLKHYQIHWELASACLWKDRFCPVGYFDPPSRERLEAIWAKTDNRFKDQFPDICSGFYRGREE